MPQPDFPVARILGCDPGKRTGVAVADLVHSERTPQCYSLLRSFRVVPRSVTSVPWEERSMAFRVLVQDAVEELEAPLAVVNEKYLVTRLTQQTQDTQAIDTTGVLRTVLELLEVKHYWFDQLPSEAKIAMPDSTLRDELGFDVSGIDGHARDALRHVCVWAVKYVRNDVQLAEKAEPGGSDADPNVIQ